MKPKLIIFDNDGVLIDSEIVWHKINAAEMTRLGFPMTVEKSIELLTRGIEEGLKNVINSEYGKSPSDDELMAINLRTEESYSGNLMQVKDIKKVLDYLEEKNIKKCVASNGDSDYILTTLTITNLINYFKTDELFGVNLSIKRKPAPDIFLQAASHFNIAPKDCLVIEDHIMGIAAAKAAHMPVIGFLGASHTKYDLHHKQMVDAEPTFIVNNSDELLDVLTQHFL